MPKCKIYAQFYYGYIQRILTIKKVRKENNMGTDLNSNILGTKRANELTKVTGNLNSIYSQSRTEQKQALSQLFKQKYFNSTTESATIDKQIEALEDKIKEFDDKIADLQDQISDKQDEIAKLKSEIADEVAQIVSDTEDYEETSKRRVDQAIENAMYHYKNDSHSKRNGGERTLTDFIIEQMGLVNSQITSGRVKIDSAIEALSDPQSKLSGLVSDLEGLVGDIDSLDSQYGTTKSTLDLLKLTRDNMATAAGSYQTSDTDPSIPIFTPAKEDLADGYLGKYTSRMANRENQPTESDPAAKQEIIAKYKATAANPASGVDIYSDNNAQLRSFSQALNDGILDEMQNAGFSKKEMLESIKQIYPNIGISHGDDGTPIVPYGHGAGGQAIYNKFLNSFNQMDGALQRDDLQVAEMGNAVKNDKIITEMKNNDFSWKEAAYTLTRLWPGGGIGYNLGEKEVTLPVGDETSKGTYDALEEEIKKNYPDVKINRGQLSDGSISEDIQRSDPVGFHIGDNSYEFAIDRNQDGVLNDFTEMVGANGVDGMEEMALFDTNGDGHLNGDELKNVLILNTEHTNRDYEFLTAEQMGIQDIDLSSFTEKTQSRGEGVEGGEEDFININNSLITGTFNITMNNGTNAEGYQKYVTDEYMKAVYDPILGENVYSQLDGSTVDNVIDDAFNEGDNKLGDLNDFADLIEDAKAYDNIKAALRTKLNNAQNEAMSYKVQETANHITGYDAEVEKLDLEMSVEEADNIIDEYLEAASDAAKEEIIQREKDKQE